MNGVPEAIGTGVTKLVDINPAIGILVALLIVIIVVLARWGSKGWDAARDAAKAHSDYLEKQIIDERKDRELYDRLIEKQTGGRR